MKELDQIENEIEASLKHIRSRKVKNFNIWLGKLRLAVSYAFHLYTRTGPVSAKTEIMEEET
jgi:hypothetical protein